MPATIHPDYWYAPTDDALRQIATEAAMRVWRSEKMGPPFYKLTPGRNGAIRYKGSDLLAWLEARRRDPEAA